MCRIALAACVLALPTLAHDDLFGFTPDGGRTILEGLLAAAAEDISQLDTVRTAGEWAATLADGSAGRSAAGTLDKWHLRTLADYLAYAGPVSDVAALPPDGCGVALARYQSCHIITVTVTQARPPEQWLGTFANPSHAGVPLSSPERRQLADYLSVNAGIPIDDIPPALSAGGATY